MSFLLLVTSFLHWASKSLAMPLVVSLSRILFLRTQMVKMYIHSSTDNLQNILCTEESYCHLGRYCGVSVLMNLECLGFRRFAISDFNTIVLDFHDWF